ncbi:hypothetical protein ACLKA6_008236 [Drosophila palustris]
MWFFTTYAAAAMGDTASAATTAAATKKKYRNKKKSQQQQQQQQKTVAETAQGAAAVKAAVVHQPNGRVQGSGDATDDADVALINGIMQQVQLCNGHAQDKAKAKVSKAESVAETSKPTVAPTLNGHVNKSATINNNNHINNNNNSNNNNNNVNNNTSSRNKNNNNNSSGSGKVKNNNKSQSQSAVEGCTLSMLVPVSDPLENHEERKENVEEEQRTSSDKSASVVATSKSTANTQTTSATTTKTTAMAIATRGSPQDEAPSTSAAAAAAAAQSQPTQQQQQHQSQPQQQQQQQSLQLQLEPAISADEIIYKEYEAEHQMHDIMRLIQAELSEPYSIYTYRYFIYNWPKLCFLASHDNQYVGAIVCKLDMHMNVRRGYIAMLAVRKEYRKLKIGTTLVTKAIEAMLADNADEVVLETEMRNEPALRLYENLGFVRDKRLFRYYLNGVDALRLKLWFR